MPITNYEMATRLLHSSSERHRGHTMASEKVSSFLAVLLILLIPVTVLLFSTANSHGASYYVRSTSCSNGGSGTSGSPYCTISYALGRAGSGDTIYVYTGTYNEDLSINSAVTLRNVSGNAPRIVANSANFIRMEGPSNVTIDGLIFDDSAGNGNSLIYLEGTATGIAIRNCEFIGHSNNTETGIALSGSVSVEITGNIIRDMQYAGISYVERSTPISNATVTIQGNTIYGNQRSGIFLEGTGTGNTVSIGGDGIAANTIYNNGSWGSRGVGIRLKNLTNVSIDNNNIYSNGKTGILLENVDTVAPHVSRNTIHDNFSSGINIGGDSDLTIGTNNEIYSNGQSGIVFYVGTNSSILYRGGASTGPVNISGNDIHTNGNAGITVIDRVTGTITIDGNTIHENTYAGIALFNNCTANIYDNEIYGHTWTSGIFTGAWVGVPPPMSMAFNKANGPVQLTISRNKIHDNLSGMRLDHASGTISNNLVYNNTKAGIRFSGNNQAPYAPFGSSWGITSLTNNTLADNGTATDIYDVDS